MGIQFKRRGDINISSNVKAYIKNMQLRHLGRRASARGLTLIELVVVLAILVALAGLIIGNFPGLIKKASGATAANTIQDISRAISTRYTTKNSYGTGYDSLLGAGGTVVYSNMVAACSVPTQITVQALNAVSANDVTALANLGLTSVYHLQNNGDATWTVADLSTITPLVAGTKLATAGTVLQTNLIPADKFALLNNPVIYLFGVGKRTTLVGPDGTLLEAPTRTGTTDTENSQLFYQRYCVAFLVDGPTAGTRTARFAGTLAPTSNGFSGTDAATATYTAN